MKSPNEALYITSGVIGGVLLGTFILLSLAIGKEFAIPALITGGVVGAIVLRGPLGKALAQRLTSVASVPPEVPVEVLEELDDVRNRVVELEERLDFAERLLAQAREPERLT